MGLSLALLLLVGCAEEALVVAPPPASGPNARSDEALSNEAISLLAADYRSLARQNRAPFTTEQHQGRAQVNVYANEAGEEAYRSLAPGQAALAGFAMPVGTLLVKEMLDAAGGPPILTVMVKQPPGFDPARSDWWFGRLFADGSATDPAYVGKVGFCGSCHGGASSSDYVWGIPAENKVGP